MRFLVLAAASAVISIIAVSGFQPGDAAEPLARPTLRDGGHDFDFNVGVWKTHITRRTHPLTGSTESIQLDGTVTVRQVWGGKAQLEEIEADEAAPDGPRPAGPAPDGPRLDAPRLDAPRPNAPRPDGGAKGRSGHWEGMTLFLYAPGSHQWSQTFVGAANGAFAGSLTGEFKDGRGELYSQDTLNGRFILVRGVWSDITLDAHRYEESYSDDGGHTWEPVFTAKLTRKTS